MLNISNYLLYCNNNVYPILGLYSVCGISSYMTFNCGVTVRKEYIVVTSIYNKYINYKFFISLVVKTFFLLIFDYESLKLHPLYYQF